MSSSALPGELALFIRQHIHSVLQLEILLMLRQRAVEWRIEEVASELRVSRAAAELRLEDLRLRGLLRRGARAGSYVYAPVPFELGRLVDLLATCYGGSRYTVTNLIFSEPGDAARGLREPPPSDDGSGSDP